MCEETFCPFSDVQMRAINHDETETRSVACGSKQDNNFTPVISTVTYEANCLSSIIATCKLEINYFDHCNSARNDLTLSSSVNALGG